jgi:hypothetical protein
MQIPILSGIFTDNGPDIRTSYPVNLIPVPKQSGISTGYLRPGDGVVANGTGPGTDRGGINYRGVLYRVMGTKLVEVSNTGAVTVLGDVGTGSLVTFTYSFDLLAIASGGRLYYWNGTTLTQVTDPDIGVVLDVVWVDGYFMTTDGEFLIVTELTDPLLVNPLKYGSSEADPDPIVAILKLRNEIYALNRNTIEVFDNVGGEFFPFQRIEGAQIQKGVVGTHACCVYVDNIAFLGSGVNEPPGIFVGANGEVVKISTQEIDELLLNYTEVQLALVQLEARNDKAHTFLYVHLPDRTCVYNASASKELGQQVWFTLTSSIVGFSQYRARNMVYAYDKWLVGDPQTSNIGYLVDTIGTHWGQKVRWQFGTLIIYNDSKGVIIHEMELVSLTGRVALGIDPKISTSYSLDGLSFGQERFISVGTIGNTKKRLAWYQLGSMRNFRIQRFQGDSDSHVAYARLEARLEALEY